MCQESGDFQNRIEKCVRESSVKSGDNYMDTQGVNLCKCQEKLFLSSSACLDDVDEQYHAFAASAAATGSNFLPLREKFDSAASLNFYGSKDRIKLISDQAAPIKIEGFTASSKAISTEVGINEDGQECYVVKGMSEDLALLSAYLYAQDGAALLFPSDGIVLKLTTEELKELKEFIGKYDKVFKLKVVNNTYEVVREIPKGKQTSTVSTTAAAMTGTAAKFFNTKVNVSNTTQRILTMLLTGLSFNDLYSIAKHNSMTGLPPDLTIQHLNTFSHKYGRTPDILRLAKAQQMPNRQGLMDAGTKPSKVGDRLEVDIMEADYNDPSSKKGQKIATWGGAICAAVGVDCFSGYVIGKLLKAKSNTIEFLTEFVQFYRLLNHNVKLLASDSGIVSMSKYNVWTTETMAFLLKEGIAAERAEPNNHERGSPTVERTIGMIKELMNLAIVFLLRNPYFNEFGFELMDIYKLWGELFLWAITIINLKPSPKMEEKTRFELFHGYIPNFQRIRILPIFSVILILQKGNTKRDYSNKLQHRLALYVGPAHNTPGAIRAAVKTEQGVQIVTTSKFTAATDGGGLVGVHEMVHKGVSLIINAEDVAVEAQDSMKGVIYAPATGPGESIVTTNEKQKVVSQENLTVVPPVIVPEVGSDNKTVEQINPVSSVPSGEGAVEAVENSSAVSESKHTKEKSSNTTVQLIEETQEQELNAEHTTKNETVVNDTELELKSGKQMRKKRNRSKKKKAEKVIATPTNIKKIQGGGDVEENPYKRIYNKHPQRISLCMALWENYENSNIYYSFVSGCYVQILEQRPPNTDVDENGDETTLKNGETAYVAVKNDVPKTFQQALQHPIWGAPSRSEWQQFQETQALVEVDAEMAYAKIRSKKAQLVLLFPVYEQKFKDGKTVLKVRLVGDGSRQHTTEPIYAATPSREELLLLLQIVASLDWELVHLDEIRAFLNAKKKSNETIFAKFKGDGKVYEVVNALYGLKNSPRDYQLTVRERLKDMGFNMLKSSQCLFIYRNEEQVVVVYVYVDDFILTGSDMKIMKEMVQQTRRTASTTSPIYDPTALLGMEMQRNRENRTIQLTMVSKIKALAASINITAQDNKALIPIPASGYIIEEQQIPCHKDTAELMVEDKAEYMRIVGSLIWISGVRPDILLATMYLSWNTKKPMIHHKRMGYHVVQYLYNTMDLPMVIGGSLNEGTFKLSAYTDASLGTAPKGKSVIAHLVKANEEAASIITKAKATTNVYMSSFEAELDGYISSTRSMQRLRNLMEELQIALAPVSNIGCDNKALVEFIKGNGEPKGLRHIALRLWAAREEYSFGNLNLDHIPGTEMPADALTKVKDIENFEEFRAIVLGHKLWIQENKEETQEKVSNNTS